MLLVPGLMGRGLVGRGSRVEVSEVGGVGRWLVERGSRERVSGWGNREGVSGEGK